MALSNADIPIAETPAAKAGPKSEAVAEPAAEPKPVLAPRLGRAGASGDAGVHILLAQRQIHASNGDDAAVKAVDDQLAALGLAV